MDDRVTQVQSAPVEVGCLVRVPASANHRLATVTEEASQGGRWRIDWVEPMTGQHCWAWWDTSVLEVVASRGEVEQHELDRAGEWMEAHR